MQKHVNLVDLVKSFPTNIFLQNLASIQKRTSPVKFAHLAEESEKGSISNLSTKGPAAPERRPPGRPRSPGPDYFSLPFNLSANEKDSENTNVEDSICEKGKQ